MVTISGTLTNGASKAITDCTIILKAKKTTNNVLVKTEAHEVSETGAYNINVQPGLYDVVLLENGFPPKQIGVIEVKSNSKSGTLNDFLILPITGSVVSSELLDQLIEERTLAQTAADNAKTSETNAKNSANSAASTLSGAVKKTGDTMAGDLIIKKKTPRFYLLNEENEEGIILLSTETGFRVYPNNETTQYIAEYRYTSKVWDFRNNISINNLDVIKRGDCGIGASEPVNIISGDISIVLETGFYLVASGVTTGNIPFANANMIVHRRNSTSQSAMAISTTGQVKFGYFSGGIWTWYNGLTSANSTVDSNGFYKKASPIVRLFASDNIEAVDGFEKSGCGLVNSEAKGITAKRIDIGHYEIHGSLGFAKESWYITLPEDANGNKKIFAEYSEDESGVITVKCFTRRFDIERCEIVADKPCDIPDSRWIDIRLEMPETDSSIDDEIMQENNDDLSSEQQAE